MRSNQLSYAPSSQLSKDRVLYLKLLR